MPLVTTRGRKRIWKLYSASSFEEQKQHYLNIHMQILGGIEKKMEENRIGVGVDLCTVGWCTRVLSLACVPAGSQLTCIILWTVVLGGVFDSAIADPFYFGKLVGRWVGLHGGAVEDQRPFFQFPWRNDNETIAWPHMVSGALQFL